MKNIDWFTEIAARLKDYPDKNILSFDGDEILCKTEDVADTLANMIENLYKSQGEEVIVNTGYYDPEEDERCGEVSDCTGYWYLTC